MFDQNMCELNGWKYGSDKHTAMHELFKELWRNLSDQGDEDLDGEITQQEWVRDVVHGKSRFFVVQTIFYARKYAKSNIYRNSLYIDVYARYGNRFAKWLCSQ